VCVENAMRWPSVWLSLCVSVCMYRNTRAKQSLLRF
jgi:hypothetical protein